MLKGRYGIGWMIVAWLALAALLGASVGAAMWVTAIMA